MTLKKLAILGGVIAGAAYLQNKNRRDRTFTGARDLLSQLRSRAQSLGHDAQSKMDSVREGIGNIAKKTEASREDFGRTSTGGVSSYSGMTPPTTYR